VVDLGLMRGVAAEPDARRASVEGGAHLGDLDGATQRVGLVTPSGGRLAQGVAGLTLGGGFGWLLRLQGLTCYSLVTAEVVTAAGDVVAASDDKNAELLWALRGGGGNFGVVTRFEFELHQLASPLWTATFAYGAEVADAALAALAEVAAGAPRELTLYAWVGEARAEPFLQGRVARAAGGDGFCGLRGWRGRGESAAGTASCRASRLRERGRDDRRRVAAVGG
jgi:FAD/FMN-containing dehydrogenase